MDSFLWDSHFVTGLDEVDSQHRKLVEMVNDFGSLLAENEVSFSGIESVLAELGSYSENHFTEEERLMDTIGVDKRHTNYHIAQHYSFLEEVKNMASTLTEDNPDTIKDLFNFLTNWLVYHILGTDQNMARQIQSVESGLSPEEAYEKEEKEANEATGPLLKALDNLFEQVSIRNKELFALNQTLEARVKERTKELHEVNQHLEEISLTDVLTGLPNRRHAMKTLTLVWEESVNENTPLSLMMIDADHFKEINDTHGHDAGDAVLCELSKSLRYYLRTDDIVCRLGGDEFLVICPKTDLKGCMHIAEIMRHKISELRVPAGDAEWKGSISVGIAAKETGFSHFEKLIKVADQGVYAAKRDGKNCVRTVQKK